MNENKTVPSLRLLMLITHTKFADKASKMFSKSEMAMHYKLNAVGTASSEMMDILGLGSSEKSVLVSIIPKNLADDSLKKLHKELKLGSVNSGIAFTAKLSGISNLIVKMYSGNLEYESREDEDSMSETNYSMIAAVVNPGYSEEVMNAARAAGAGGGSVIHSRRISDDKTVASWGLDIQEEKEIVIIVTGSEHKLPIMQAIGKNCGVHSDAKGFVLSLPIETVIGLSD